jgi:hypothetical protein
MKKINQKDIEEASQFLCNYTQPTHRTAYVLGFEEGIIWYKEHSDAERTLEDISEVTIVNGNVQEAFDIIQNMVSHIIKGTER